MEESTSRSLTSIPSVSSRFLVRDVLTRYSHVSWCGRFRSNTNSNCIRSTRIIRGASLSVFIDTSRTSRGSVALLSLGAVCYVSNSLTARKTRRWATFRFSSRVLCLHFMEKSGTRICALFRCALLTSFTSMYFGFLRRWIYFQFVSTTRTFSCGFFIRLRFKNIGPARKRIRVRCPPINRFKNNL